MPWVRVKDMEDLNSMVSKIGTNTGDIKKQPYLTAGHLWICTSASAGAAALRQQRVLVPSGGAGELHAFLFLCRKSRDQKVTRLMRVARVSQGAVREMGPVSNCMVYILYNLVREGRRQWRRFHSLSETIPTHRNAEIKSRRPHTLSYS